MTTSTEFIESLKQTKGPGWGRLVEKWVEVMRRLEAIPENDPHREADSRRLMHEMQLECRAVGLPGAVPAGVYEDAKVLRELVMREENDGGGAEDGDAVQG